MSTTIFLFSSLTTSQIAEIETRRMHDIFKAEKLMMKEIDGVDPANKELRDKLFALSGQKGKYPQCFIEDSEGNIEYIGMFSDLEGLVDCDQLPAEVLKVNPQIKTFKKVFENVMKIENDEEAKKESTEIKK